MPHPLGIRARILLTSVFGPYARDEEYGSRAINPMELYHNQVTRVQGPFSLRMFHRSRACCFSRQMSPRPAFYLIFPVWIVSSRKSGNAATTSWESAARTQ